MRLPLLLCCSLAAKTFAAPTEVASTQPTPIARPTNALSIRVTGGGSNVSTPFTLSFVPSPGVFFEHSFGRLSLGLGVNGAFSRSRMENEGSGALADSMWGTLDPSVRWSFRDTPLSGPWIGASLPLSINLSSVFAGASSSFAGGVEVLGGWSFLFESGLLVQLAAGPSIQLAQSTNGGYGGLGGLGNLGSLSSVTIKSATLSLRGYVSIGTTF